MLLSFTPYLPLKSKGIVELLKGNKGVKKMKIIYKNIYHKL